MARRGDEGATQWSLRPIVLHWAESPRALVLVPLGSHGTQALALPRPGPLAILMVGVTLPFTSSGSNDKGRRTHNFFGNMQAH
jgi:hypothetical protein